MACPIGIHKGEIMKKLFIGAFSILFAFSFAAAEIQETTIEADNVQHIHFTTQEESSMPTTFGIYDRHGEWYFYTFSNDELKIKIANSLMSQVMLAKSLGRSITIRWEEVLLVRRIRSIYVN
jgi:hypothetical protein